jgi:hypothetical protein
MAKWSEARGRKPTPETVLIRALLEWAGGRVTWSEPEAEANLREINEVKTKESGGCSALFFAHSPG